MKSEKKLATANPDVTRQRQDKRLQKIARQYDRLEEALSELEAMLPELDLSRDAASDGDDSHRPRKPR